jgi:hypothetical protein
MKTKIFTLILLLFAFLNAVNVCSQTISNSSFENWSQQVLFEDPVPYITTNMNVIMMGGSGNVTKSTDHNGGLYSARLETMQFGADTIFGGVFLGIPGSAGITGGAAMAVHPDSLTVSAKYNLQTNDTAYVLVLFKKNGVMIGIGAFAFAGIQNTFTQFKTPVTWYQTDSTDTVSAIITSSALDPPQFPGSILYVDDLNFIGGTIPFPNGDFETWNNVSVEDPDDWFTLNFADTPGNYSVTKSTDSYDGTYAAQIENVITTFGDTMGFITNGRFGGNNPEGGMHVLLNPEKVTGYYKYTPVGLDTALAACFIYGNDTLGNYGLLDSALVMLEPKPMYTYFEIPIAYNSWPLADTLNIAFASGNLENENSYVGLGSTLLIDKLEVTYKPMSVNENSTDNNNVNIFPNPAYGNCDVTIGNSDIPLYSIELYSETGQKIYSEIFDNAGTVNHLKLSMLSKGLYYLKIQNGEKIITKKLIIQ